MFNGRVIEKGTSFVRGVEKRFCRFAVGPTPCSCFLTFTFAELKPNVVAMRLHILEPRFEGNLWQGSDHETVTIACGRGEIEIDLIDLRSGETEGRRERYVLSVEQHGHLQVTIPPGVAYAWRNRLRHEMSSLIQFFTSPDFNELQPPEMRCISADVYKPPFARQPDPPPPPDPT